MATGQVINYDQARGYGFIAPASGGEDVFLHVRDLMVAESSIRYGTAVEFELEDGPRGPKAANVRLQAPAVSATATAGAGAVRGEADEEDEDADLCDHLTASEFTAEVTEVLLAAEPTLTGQQIRAIRRTLLDTAIGHGWIEN